MNTLFDWNNLRAHNGSLTAAFEQLCAILAHRESCFNNPGWEFVRNGRPDGGVECYWQAKNGDVHGFQAKYFLSALGNSQWNQLSESVRQAIKKYPQLRSMTVCLPQDLPHSPKSGVTSAREKWKKWRTSFQRGTRRKDGQLEIKLWDQHDIVTRLTEPRNVGLLNFFFNANLLTHETMLARLNEQIDRAGTRYQPAVHVSSRLEPVFDWLVSSETFRSSWGEQLAGVSRLVESETLAQAFHHEPAFSGLRQELIASITALRESFRMPAGAPRDALARRAGDSWSALNSFMNRQDPRWSKKPEDMTDTDQEKDRQARWNAAEDVIEKIIESRSDLGDALERSFVKASDNRIVMINGSGGCGKTHLVCEMARRAAADGRPVVLVLGQQLRVDHLWADLLEPFGGFRDHHEFLRSLDVAGEVHGCRSLLIIDALNEAESNNRWPAEVRALVAAVAAYSHVAVVLTIRDSYREELWPSTKISEHIAEYGHGGFIGQTPVAIATYCDHYNIALPDVPLFNPEFENPLFLSMFCRAISPSPDPERRRATLPFPGGIDSFSRVFSLFVERREDELRERLGLDLDHSSTPLRDAISELADRMSESPSLEVPFKECKAILEKHLHSEPPIRSIVGLMESEGLLLRVARRGPNRIEESVQFAYDRMGAHLVVSRWLAGEASGKSAASMLRRRGILRDIDSGTFAHGRAESLCEALHMQWPERFGAELFDSLPKLFPTSHWRTTYLSAMRVAPASAFRPTSAKWLKACLDAENDRRRASTIESLFARVSSPGLVEALHSYLNAQQLASRDSWWTVGIGTSGWRESRETLTSWPFSSRASKLSGELALSYATSLAWLTCTTALALRATATKAITCVLEGSTATAALLIERFRDVNDPYILQSVCIAAYGACLRSSDYGATRVVAEKILTLWPAKARWPVDLLTRHALAGTVEVAGHRDPTWNVDVTRATPPYKSGWLKELPSWRTIERRVNAKTKKKLYGFSTIVSSCYPEGARHAGGYRMYGDFGRYVVGSACHGFFDNNGPGSPKKVKPSFSFDTPHRFIIKRVLELGWTETRFEDFDRSLAGGDRHRKTEERIGKKYQWIALGEFLARAADRFPLYSGWGSESSSSWYEHPRQFLHEFCLDTSILRVGERAKRDLQEPGWWASRNGESFWKQSSDDAWLLCDQGVPGPSRYVVQTPPASATSWSMLWGYLSWEEKDPRALVEEDALSRSIFLHVRSFAVRKQDCVKLQAWFRKHRARELHRPQHLGESMFGELYWSRSAKCETGGSAIGKYDPWCRPSGRVDEAPFDMIPLGAQYLNESDPTFGSSLYALIPSRWLVERLGLRAGPGELEFRGVGGELVCWNPSVPDGGADVVFADTNRVEAALASEGLRLVWTVTGEKNVLGGGMNDDKPLWPWIQGLYWLQDDQVHGGMTIQYDEDFRAGRPRARPKTKRPSKKLNPKVQARLQKWLNEMALVASSKPVSPAKARRKEGRTQPAVSRRAQSKRQRRRS